MQILKPSEYLQEIVLPTIKEFEEESASVRRAYLACVTVYHFVDAVSFATSQGIAEIMNELKSRSEHFQYVRDVAVLAKHIHLDKNRPENRGRHLISQTDVVVGYAAPFTDGTYFSDGTSWTDSPQTVTVRDDNDLPTDILFCVQDSVQAITAYLAAHPSL